jgi:hypothetical protein
LLLRLFRDTVPPTEITWRQCHVKFVFQANNKKVFYVVKCQVASRHWLSFSDRCRATDEMINKHGD